VPRDLINLYFKNNVNKIEKTLYALIPVYEDDYLNTYLTVTSCQVPDSIQDENF